MFRRLRTLAAAALVYRHVDDNAPRLHEAEHLARYDLWSLRAGHENRSDQKIGALHQLGDDGAGGKNSAHRTPEPQINLAQRLRIAVRHDDIGAHAERDRRGVRSHDAAAQNDDLGRWNTRHAGKQDAASSRRPLQTVSADLRREPARDLRHRRQQWKTASRGGYGFIGDAMRS